EDAAGAPAERRVRRAGIARVTGDGDNRRCLTDEEVIAELDAPADHLDRQQAVRDEAGWVGELHPPLVEVLDEALPGGGVLVVLRPPAVGGRERPPEVRRDRLARHPLRLEGGGCEGGGTRREGRQADEQEQDPTDDASSSHVHLSTRATALQAGRFRL